MRWEDGYRSTKRPLTDRRFFAAPASARQRQYEALRAYFLEARPSAEVARRFGYSPGAFRVLCHDFRHDLLPEFFATPRRGPRLQPKKDQAQKQIVALRKRNYSIYDISAALKEAGMPLSPTAVREVLKAEGFAALPRRLDEERPGFHRRAHLPIVLASDLLNKPVAVPWWAGRSLRLLK